MSTFNKIVIFFFSPTPSGVFNYYYPIGALIILFIAVTLAIYFYSIKNKKDKAFKKQFRNYPTKFIILAVLLTSYLFLRYYSVPFFSMRFMLTILLISSGIVIYTAIITLYKKYPEEKSLRIKREEQNKYISKKRKK